MTPFEAELSSRLEAIRAQGLYRQLRRIDSPQATRIEIDGRSFLNFASNDYLGLAKEPALAEASIKAVEKFGSGSGASRLICGSLSPHCELEELLADFKQTEAALSFSSGYSAAVGTICALMGKDDIIVLDKLVHASIVDAARLSGAKIRVFDHNDLNDLEKILQWADAKQIDGTTKRPNVLIVTESIFSMDGDSAPLREIVELKNKHGAWLMVDEAHGTGLYGLNRRGLAEELGVSSEIEVQMGTLGKAIGASGGYICGSRNLVDLLINRARSFIFSTAPVPASAAAATAGLRFMRSADGESRRNNLKERVKTFRAVRGLGPEQVWSAIQPIIIGSETAAVETAVKLRDAGVFVPAVRYPTVARGAARLRITLTAGHTEDELAELFNVLETVGLGSGCNEAK
ncbi:MAG: aminotransferase class I/II-fold pyridoxal phosphate-dependent enzyme [Limisphaerales bacterium]